MQTSIFSLVFGLLSLLGIIPFINLHAQQLTIAPGTQMIASGNVKIVLDDIDFIQNGTFSPGNSEVVFQGTENSSIQGSESISFYDLTIDKTANHVQHSADFAVQHSLVFSQGNLVGDLINNPAGPIISLGSGAYLSGEFPGSIAINNIITKTVNYPNGQVAAADSGNLGFEFTRAGIASNQLTIERTNGNFPFFAAWQNGPSVAKRYQITPSSTPVDGIVKVSYFDSEFLGNNEADQQLVHQYQGPSFVSSDTWEFDPINNFGRKPTAKVQGLYTFGEPSSMLFSLSGAAKTESGDTIPQTSFLFVDPLGTTFDQEQIDTASRFTLHHAPQIFGTAGAQLSAFRPVDTDPRRGVDVGDVVALTQDILGINELGSAVKELAGDVNKDLVHSSADLLLMRAFILGANAGFLADANDTALQTIWDFIPSNTAGTLAQNEPTAYDPARTYVNGYQTTATDQDFIGIKLGDVNSSWTPSPSANKNRETIYFDLPSLTVNPNQTFRVPVLSRQIADISGYQFTLSWDPSIMRFAGLEQTTLAHHVNQTHQEEGYVTVIWNDPQGQNITLPDGTEVFALAFEAIGAWQANSTIHIHGDLTPAIGYTADLMAKDIAATPGQIVINTTTHLDPTLSEFQFAAWPNPFAQSSTLALILPEDGQVDLVIYNTLGQKVQDFSGWYQAGEQRIIWDGKHQAGYELTEGVYHIELTYGSHKQSLSIQKK